MDAQPQEWREVWNREAEDPVPDPLVEHAKRMRQRVSSARHDTERAAAFAADPIRRPSARQAAAYAEELFEVAIEVVEEWRRSGDPRRSQLLGRAVISLKKLIETAASDQEPVEPAATAEG